MIQQVICTVLSIILIPQGAMASAMFSPGGDRPDQNAVLRLEKLIDRPYLELLAQTSVRFAEKDLDQLRNQVKDQREAEQDRIEREEKQLKEQVKQTRDELKQLNASGSRDTPAVGAERENLHERIQELEKQIEQKTIAREKGVPLIFENKLAKIDLLEQWPDRRKEIEEAIESGQARERRFGDVEDIGIRILVDGQEDDIEVGQRAVREMRASGTLPRALTEPLVSDYVKELATRIATHSDLRIPIRVEVLDSDEINAFALPGGFLFVNRGLIEKAETESELAGVIAHEIAHVAARHGRRLMRKASIANLLTQAAQVGVLIFTGGAASLGAYYLYQFGFAGLGLFIDLNLLGVNRDYESEADQLGVQYLWKSGYDPNGFVTFFDKMASDEGYVRSASFFRTHPPFFDRIVSTFSEIEFLPQKDQVQVDSSAFQRVKLWIHQHAVDEKKQEEYRPTLRRTSLGVIPAVQVSVAGAGL